MFISPKREGRRTKTPTTNEGMGVCGYGIDGRDGIGDSSNAGSAYARHPPGQVDELVWAGGKDDGTTLLTAAMNDRIGSMRDCRIEMGKCYTVSPARCI